MNLADNMAIKSNNFNVDSAGNLKCNNAEMENAVFNGGNIELYRGTGQTTVFGIYTDKTDNSEYRMIMFDRDIEGYKYTDKLFFIGEIRDVYGNTIGGGLQLNNSNNETNINMNGSDGSITCVSLTQTSQEKNKKNFEKLQDNALDILKTIDIYKYNLKNEKDTDKKHIGFVIGDNFNYSKEVTSLDNQGVDNYSFTSLCCKAIQELSAQVKELQKEISELKDKEEK